MPEGLRASGLRRYEFGEQLAEILGESRGDLRFRVTMLVSGGIVKPGPRGRGSPMATPFYGANLLLGAMAAPQQAHTVEAIRCYWGLKPVARSVGTAGPGVFLGPPEPDMKGNSPAVLPLGLDKQGFGECLTQLLELATSDVASEYLAQELFGVWVSRSCPVAGIQVGVWSRGCRSVITQRFELPEEAGLPVWLDPNRDGAADPGLLHTIFLPAGKLIEIGQLTTPEKKETHPMFNPGAKISRLTDLINLVQQGNYRSRWETLLTALAKVQAWTNEIGNKESPLIEVTDFGANPGDLRMFSYVPAHLSPQAPLVVALHGCTQTAAAYNQGTGWSELADRFGFALLFPQQCWSNNPLRCFNWFRPEDTIRDSGEVLSIRQMIEWMRETHDLNPQAIHVTGLSSGGAMTSAMLATYPEVFAGGAIVSGTPYRAADGLQEAFEVIFKGTPRTGDEWGERVREASSHQGPWPRISVWHGDQDSAVAPVNAEEIVKQWLHVHGLSEGEAVEENVDGHPRRMWRDSDGQEQVESYTVVGMAHGQPLNTADKAHACGVAGPFFNDVGISSTHRIAEFWGIPGICPERQPPLEEEVSAEEMAAKAQWTVGEGVSTWPLAASAGARTEEVDEKFGTARPDTTKGNDKGQQSQGMPFGIDVQKIISTSLSSSLGMAGLLKESGGDGDSGADGAGQKAPFGIDVQGIVSESLKAAGILAGAHQPASNQSPPHRSSPQAKDNQEGDSGWQGDGWSLVSESQDKTGAEPILFGHASSGNDCKVGDKVRSISREIPLGGHPSLSYVRRLALNAAANDYTRARFSVLVDGLPVDEVSAVGMEHTEGEWLQRSRIDLTPFANQTVTLTFEVAAHSNVCNEVSAKAWVDQVQVQDTV